MTIQEFIDRIVSRFGFTPTVDQQVALQVFARFLADREPNVVMILRGSAGTGKTSLASAMVLTLRSLGQKLVLMAPTGRAAKVFSQSCGMPAYTIHRTIYREKSYTGLGGIFDINFNKYHNALFVADEASMISGMPSFGESGGGCFGSGSLLDDLMQYVYSGQGCRLLLIGDKAQLPPVGEAESPALSAEVLAGYNMRVYQCDLNEVLRQGGRSGILYNATAIRNMITHDELTQLPKIKLKSFADIVMVPGNELIESLQTSYNSVGEDDTLVITRSNKRSNIYNQGIRNSILDREEALCGGDMLMVVKNKYAPTPGPSPSGRGAPSRKGIISPSPSVSGAALPSAFSYLSNSSYSSDSISRKGALSPLPEGEGSGVGAFIANGDRCIVRRVRHFEELYGFHFAEAVLQFPDLEGFEFDTTVIMDTLTSESPSLTREQNETLYNNVMEDYQDVPLKADRMKALRQDRYYNALQVKFAYAVTCHKAQGGQWRHVYIDQGYMTDDMLTPDYIHWLYTAFTRATDKLFLVNWPKTQVE